MNHKNIFFIFFISITYFFNVSAQRETLFYAFNQGQVYFLLEFKQRKISNSNIYHTEWSWGPSLIKRSLVPGSPINHYVLHLEKTRFRPLKNKEHVWVKIEKLETFKNQYWEETQNNNGLSILKIDSLPIIDCKSKIEIKNLRQQKIYYQVIEALRKEKPFLKKLFEQLKKEANQEYRKELVNLEASKKLDRKEWEWICEQLKECYLGNL